MTKKVVGVNNIPFHSKQLFLFGILTEFDFASHSFEAGLANVNSLKNLFQGFNKDHKVGGLRRRWKFSLCCVPLTLPGLSKVSLHTYRQAALPA